VDKSDQKGHGEYDDDDDDDDDDNDNDDVNDDNNDDDDDDDDDYDDVNNSYKFCVLQILSDVAACYLRNKHNIVQQMRVDNRRERRARVRSGSRNLRKRFHSPPPLLSLSPLPPLHPPSFELV